MANTVLLEARSYRPFKSSEEYLYAMREDLAEWLNTLYPELRINVDNFMDRLDTGVALCKHANNVRTAAEEYLARRLARSKSMTKSMTSGLAGPILAMGNVHFLPAAKSGTFFARDNVSNFITWCRKSLQIFECLLFETDDLIMRKNEKHVILCLLEVARRGAKLGMLAPMLVQMERQIDREIAADNKAMGVSIGTETDKMAHSISVGTDGDELFDSDSEDEDAAEEPVLVYGPQPQIITNDLKSLDEMVRDLVEKCTCPSQFPMVRVSEGKYRIGDTKVLIFVRILRSHVMVRVGGGWDTLSHYLDKHDPCRCRAQHRSSVAARLIPRTNAATNGIELHKAQVFYERSPPVTRKSTSNTNSPVLSNGATNNNSLSPPARGRSRSPTPQRRSLMNGAENSGPSSLDSRRSVSPKSRIVQKKRLQINEPVMNSLFTVTSTAEEIIPEITPVEAVQPTTQIISNQTPVADAKFENISDNGSEISDEGYRSLGLIQNNGHPNAVDKRTSTHSQISTDDAEYSARLEREPSNDSSQLTTTSSGENTPTQVSSSCSKTVDEEDLGSPSLGGNDNFEKSGVFINEDEIKVDIASATGLRKTDFSTLYDEKKKSKIPRSPLPAIRSRRSSTENLSVTDSPSSTGLPVLQRKSPVYSSVRRIIQKPMTNAKNTWNGRDNNPTATGSMKKQRPGLSNDTFQSPSFNRNSPSRNSQQGFQYDKNGRRIKASSVNTSPVKQSSPLAQQLLAAAENAKDDTQIIDAMKQLLRQYSEKSPAGDDFDDFTTAWVNSNGSLDRTNTSSPTKSSTFTAKHASTISSQDSCHSKDGVSSRRSKIPAPIRHNTELY